MNLLLISLFTFFMQPATINQVQKQTSVNALDTAKVVSALKTKFLAIEAKRKFYSLFSYTEKEEGKAFFGYFEDKAPRLINANTYSDSGKVEADAYLDETGIFIIYAKHSEYENLLSQNPRTKIKSTSDNWYYFKNETLIKWVSAGKVVPAGSAQFKQKSASFKQELAATKKRFSDPAKLSKIK